MMNLNAITHWGPMYWNAATYRSAMWFLRSPGERELLLRRVADEVGTNSVLDLCCGPGDLHPFLHSRKYTGVDLHPGFIRGIQRQGLNAICADALRTPWPEVECLVVVDSLYYFMAEEELFWKRVRESSARRVIITESVENWQPKLPPGLRSLGLWLTRVNGRPVGERYTESDLKTLLHGIGFDRFYRTGHNVTAVWEKALSAAPRSSQTPDTALQTSAR